KPQSEYDLRDRKSKLPSRTEDIKPTKVTYGYGNEAYYIDVHKPRVFANFNVEIPSQPAKEFACEVVGKVGLANVVWGLRLLNAKKDRAIDVALGSIGDIEVRRMTGQAGEMPKSLAGPLKPSAQKSGNHFNTLLVILRGQFLEIYVNGRSACDPVLLDAEDAP